MGSCHEAKDMPPIFTSFLHCRKGKHLLHIVAQACPTSDVALCAHNPITALEVLETDPTSLQIQEGLQTGRDGCSIGTRGLVKRNHVTNELRKPLRGLPQSFGQILVLPTISRANKIELDALQRRCVAPRTHPVLQPPCEGLRIATAKQGVQEQNAEGKDVRFLSWTCLRREVEQGTAHEGGVQRCVINAEVEVAQSWLAFRVGKRTASATLCAARMRV
eukprot:scaffold86203_cov34-Tisochrysis_lutea.AAC.2